MVEVKIGNLLGKVKIELYSSIKEMPVDRFNEFNKLAAIDMGVGSTLQDFNNHFSKLHSYVVNNSKDNALLEMSNIYQNFFYAINKISIWSYSFCAFIKSINGKEYTETEIPKHRDTIKMLSDKGLKVDECQSVIDEVKKNLIQSFDSSFLADIATRETLTYYQSLKDSL